MEFIKRLIRAAMPAAKSAPPIYIFDLDGTLSDAEHRRHLVSGDQQNWPAFFAASVRDKPKWPVIMALRAAMDFGCDVRIWSGRSDAVRKATVHWLSVHLELPAQFVEKILWMRKEGDTTPDDVLKQTWLNLLDPEDYMRIQAVYDDRQKVVDMWRRNGIPCFQVAPGDF